MPQQTKESLREWWLTNPNFVGGKDAGLMIANAWIEKLDHLITQKGIKMEQEVKELFKQANEKQDNVEVEDVLAIIRNEPTSPSNKIR